MGDTTPSSRRGKLGSLPVPDITNEISDVSPNAVKHGGWADIYTAVWHQPQGDTKVAIKVQRPSSIDPLDKKAQKALKREMSIWKRLSHPNIHDMYGVYTGIGKLPSLVSPWSNQGHINHFLKKHVSHVDYSGLKKRLMEEVASGLEYCASPRLQSLWRVLTYFHQYMRIKSFTEISKAYTLKEHRLLSRLEHSITSPGDRSSTAKAFLDDIAATLRMCHLQDRATFDKLFLLRDSDLAIQILHRLFIWSHATVSSITFSEELLRTCTETVSGRTDFDKSRGLFAQLASGPLRPMKLLRSELQPLARLLSLASPLEAFELMKHFSIPIIRRLVLKRTAAVFVHWLPDGKRLAAACTDGTVRIFDADAAAAQCYVRGHQRRVNQIAIFPDGKLGASGSDDKSVLVWNVETGEAVRTPMTGHTAPICSVAVSPDATHIASGSKDATIRIWSFETRWAVVGPIYGHSGSVTCLAYSHNGSSIASGSKDGTLRVWETTEGACILGPLVHGKAINSLLYSPDGSYIIAASDDGTISLWHAATGRPYNMPGHWPKHVTGILCIVYSRDGSHLASACRDGTIRVWDASTGKCQLFEYDDVHAVTFSPDGSVLASVSGDGSVALWDTTNQWLRSRTSVS